MGSFSLSGGVEVFGFISPSNTMDQYPVIDPLYGIDGLRNVNNLSDLDLIPTLRRRAGMLVGVSGGTIYYKLKDVPWNNTINDWELFELGSNFTGGTVTGATIFTNGVTANTFSATTYLGLPSDIYVSGFTYLDNTLTIERSSGNPNLFVTINDFTGLTINGDLNVTGNTIVDGITANTISATTYQNLPIDPNTYITAFTYSSNTLTIFDNFGSTFDVTINDFTGLTINGDLNVTGNTIVDGITANTISASTYLNLPIDVFVTGGTLNKNTDTITFTNNTGGTFNVTGITDTFVTGATFSGTSLTISQNENQPDIVTNIPTISLSGALSSVTFNIVTTGGISASTISATTYQNLPTDIRVTGGTYSAGTATFTNNTGGTFNVSGFVTGDTFVTGLTFNNSNYDLTITRNDGVSFTDSLSILASDLTVTGGTYNPSTGTATFTNNSGGTFNVTGFLTGFTDIYVTGGTYSAGTATFTNTSGSTFDVTGFSKYFVATTEPTGTTINLGDRWFNLTDGVELVYIDTGGGFQWIEPNPGGEFVFPYLALSGGTVSGATTFTNGLFANSISATTYLNLPTDVFVTGGTYSAGTTTFTNNTGGTFSISGFSEPFTGGSGSCITELYIEDLFSCNTGITLNNDIIPNTDNSINLGTPITRFREINTVSGTSTIWSATTRIYTPEVDLGLDGLGNSRKIDANNSIIQNDILLGGSY
jgi:hypothetical protein